MHDNYEQAMFRIGDEWSDDSYAYIIVDVDEDEARVRVFDGEGCVMWHSESDWEQFLVDHELIPDTVPIGERLKEWYQYNSYRFTEVYKGQTAWWRDEHEPCEAGTPGCSTNHVVGTERSCETW